MMKKILYISNIEVPYRAAFFDSLAKECSLTVVYERRKSKNRDADWSKNCDTVRYDRIFLDGMELGNENGFSFRILKILSQPWDAVVFGCYNSCIQIVAMAYMKMLGRPFIINLDGEPFIGSGIKAIMKKAILSGAKCYLVAGECASESLRRIVNTRKAIVPYYFSSLYKNEILAQNECTRERYVLVIGQYLEYKGMDVALKAARLNPNIKYKFVGMGQRSEQFRHDMKVIPDNVQIIPFLKKPELMAELRKCGVMVLPSRQECWGLVINEAASMGTPIVSTWGSGAAVEFLSKDYKQFLAEPEDEVSLMKAIELCLSADCQEYSKYLLEKSRSYNIERSVAAHCQAFSMI